MECGKFQGSTTWQFFLKHIFCGFKVNTGTYTKSLSLLVINQTLHYQYNNNQKTNQYQNAGGKSRWNAKKTVVIN